MPPPPPRLNNKVRKEPRTNYTTWLRLIKTREQRFQIKFCHVFSAVTTDDIGGDKDGRRELPHLIEETDMTRGFWINIVIGIVGL